jgi:hypothetical protein
MMTTTNRRKMDRALALALRPGTENEGAVAWMVVASEAAKLGFSCDEVWQAHGALLHDLGLWPAFVDAFYDSSAR